MGRKVLPGDPRLWDVQEDPQLYLVHAVAFLVAIVVVFFLARVWLRPRR